MGGVLGRCGSSSVENVDEFFFHDCKLNFIGSITGRILKKLATISEGKDENFPEKLLDLGFFRLHRFSLRAS